VKTYEGTILDVSDCVVTVRYSCSGGHGELDLKAGADVCAQAERLRGRKVRFQAHLHESTVCLASPIFVIGSSYGLQAVAQDARASGVRAEDVARDYARLRNELNCGELTRRGLGV
jgi:hypothetical protein